MRGSPDFLGFPLRPDTAASVESEAGMVTRWEKDSARLELFVDCSLPTEKVIVVIIIRM